MTGNVWPGSWGAVDLAGHEASTCPQMDQCQSVGLVSSSGGQKLSSLSCRNSKRLMYCETVTAPYIVQPEHTERLLLSRGLWWVSLTLRCNSVSVSLSTAGNVRQISEAKTRPKQIWSENETGLRGNGFTTDIVLSLSRWWWALVSVRQQVIQSLFSFIAFLLFTQSYWQ